MTRTAKHTLTKAAGVTCLAWLAALLTGCDDDPKPSSGNVNVVVTLSYADQEDHKTHPVVEVPVEVWSYAPRGTGIWTWAKVGSGTTDASGKHTTAVRYQNSSVLYAVRVFLSNSGARCCNGWNLPGMPSVYSPYIDLGADTGGKPTQLSIGHAGNLPFAHTFNGDTASAFNILDVLRNMAAFVRRYETNLSDDKIEKAVIGIDKKTWFDPVAYTLDFIPRDRWVDSSIRHEYGHYVQAQIGSLAWIASDHAGCTPSSMNVIGGIGNAAATEDGRRRQHAWLEGFADWLDEAAYADNPSLYAPDPGAGWLETASCPEVGPCQTETASRSTSPHSSGT